MKWRLLQCASKGEEEQGKKQRQMERGVYVKTSQIRSIFSKIFYANSIISYFLSITFITPNNCNNFSLLFLSLFIPRSPSTRTIPLFLLVCCCCCCYCYCYACLIVWNLLRTKPIYVPIKYHLEKCVSCGYGRTVTHTHTHTHTQNASTAGCLNTHTHARIHISPENEENWLNYPNAKCFY